jgi:hypothetical protein
VRDNRGGLVFVRETFIDETKGHQFGESDWYEPYTDDIGRLFRDMQKEYGRCTGHVYVGDGPDVKKVGWVFEKRMEYDDYRGRGDRFYVRTVWVRLAESVERTPPKVVVKPLVLK